MLEERKACGQWRGRAGRWGGRVARVVVLGHFLFSSVLSGEYGSMWAVGAVGVGGGEESM